MIPKHWCGILAPQLFCLRVTSLITPFLIFAEMYLPLIITWRLEVLSTCLILTRSFTLYFGCEGTVIIKSRRDLRGHILNSSHERLKHENLGVTTTPRWEPVILVKHRT